MVEAKNRHLVWIGMLAAIGCLVVLTFTVPALADMSAPAGAGALAQAPSVSPETAQKALNSGLRAKNWWDTQIIPFWTTHLKPIWTTYVQQWGRYSVGVGLAVGLLFCFLGYRLFRVALAAIGFVVGAILAGTVTHALISQSQTVLIIAGCVGGVIGAVAAFIVYLLGMFLVGALMGAGGAVVFVTQTTLTREVNPWFIVAGAAVLFGLIALLLRKVILVLFTAIAGSWAVVTAVYALLGRTIQIPTTPDSAQALAYIRQNLWLFVAWGALALLGIIVQFAFGGKRATSAPEPSPAE